MQSFLPFHRADLGDEEIAEVVGVLRLVVEYGPK